MAAIDLVFEGGGAKGMVFAGALQQLFHGGARTYSRLLGTSAGAITAVMVAAGYTPAEMLDAMAEQDGQGKSVFEAFLGQPAPFDEDMVRQSAIRKLLADLDLPLVPNFAEERLDDWIAGRLAANPYGRHLFSFVERGGWYSADAFVSWIERRLNTGQVNGKQRDFGKLTLQQFFAATNVEMTLVAADTTGARLLLLNHRTAPDCPVAWAARMSMSIPLLWQEVEWRKEWGPYHSWSAVARGLVENDITGHTVVDGGLLSNFPIALFLADRDDVAAVMGPAQNKNVLGLLIDESLPVPNRPPRPVIAKAFSFESLTSFRRLQRLINTATTANDNMAISVFAPHVVRLPAGGYGTTQFDMSDAERAALIQAGAEAMSNFLLQQTVLETTGGGMGFQASDAVTSYANDAALTILAR